MASAIEFSVQGKYLELRPTGLLIIMEQRIVASDFASFDFVHIFDVQASAEVLSTKFRFVGYSMSLVFSFAGSW